LANIFAKASSNGTGILELAELFMAGKRRWQ